MSGTHDIDVLNSLLSTVVDSVAGFAQADRSVATARFKSLFAEIASERRALAGEIEAHIREAGGAPEDEGTMLASAHRVLMRLRDAVSQGDAAVVGEAERGEDHIKAKFEKAVRDEALLPATRRFVLEASGRVRAGHDRVRDLKHALHA